MDKNFTDKIKELEKYAKENFVPVVRPKTLKKLVSLIKKTKPQNILEIGTAIGYSGILMLENSLNNTFLTTIEMIEKRKVLAEENFKNFGLSDRINLIFDDAKNVLPVLKNKYDLIFLDGPKAQYAKYLEFLLPLLNVKGFLFADDVLFRGKIEGTEKPNHKDRTIVNGLREFLNKITTNKNLKTKIYHIEDGFTITQKLKEF